MFSIGIAGGKRHGKDTIANYFVREHGFKSLAPGDLIRESLSAITGIPVEAMTHPDTKETYRKLQQDYGTMVREITGNEMVWIEAVYRRAEEAGATRLVIPSVRGEEKFVADKGGKLIFVRRDLPQDENDAHPIEQFAANADLSQYDAVIDNNSTIEELEQTVRRVMQEDPTFKALDNIPANIDTSKLKLRKLGK